MAGGVVVGIVLGFVLGRRWAEHWRAEDDARRIRNASKNYRGKSTAAFVLAAVALVGLAVWFGHTSV